ncbi:MAG TPA: hypothetical protein VF594_00130 [Rubricoccaceae bacterium]|jgi:hypothetical protein
MHRLAPLVLLATLAGCTFEGRTDGGSPLHTDNGAEAAHRDAVDASSRRDVVEPLGGTAGASSAGADNAGTALSGGTAAPVPTPRLGTVAQGDATPEAGGMNAGPIQTPPGAPGAIAPPRAQ